MDTRVDAVPSLMASTRVARREHILQAAMRCFARRGYYATTMEEIAAEAGIAKGAAYVYFASKEALFLALYDSWDCALADQIHAALAALSPAVRQSPRQVLAVLLSTTGRHVQTASVACRVLMEARILAAYIPAFAERVQAAQARTQAGLEGVIRAGIAAGEWPPTTDVALQARLVAAAMHGLMAAWHFAPGSFAWDPAAALLADLGRTAPPDGSASHWWSADE